MTQLQKIPIQFNQTLELNEQTRAVLNRALNHAIAREQNLKELEKMILLRETLNELEEHYFDSNKGINDDFVMV